jgi:hypothetical protein
MRDNFATPLLRRIVVNRLQTTLLGLGLGLALQATPAAAWWQTYSQNIPFGPTTSMGPYPTNPWIPNYGPNLSALRDFLAPLTSLDGPQVWQYPNLSYGPTAMWSGFASMGGLYIEQGEVPAGYQIRVHTGQPGLPAVDISVQGSLLVIRSQTSASGGGNAMQMGQSGWSNQSISLPADANVSAMQMERGIGGVQIFIPRRR